MKNWSGQKKKIFAIIIAVIVTIILLFLSLLINSFMTGVEGSDKKGIDFNSIKETFSDIGDKIVQ